MRFALVDPKTLRTTIVEVGPREAFAVPLASGVSGSIDEASLERIVHDTFAPEAGKRHSAILVRRNALLRKRGLTERSKFELEPPPPWLMSIAVLMLQGIVQGASWDAVKAAVRNCLRMLRASGAAPDAQGGSKTTSAEMEFGWRDVAGSGLHLRKLYLRLQLMHRDKGFLYPGKVHLIGRESPRERLNERAHEKASVQFPIAPTTRKRPSQRPKRKPRRTSRRAGPSTRRR